MSDIDAVKFAKTNFNSTYANELVAMFGDTPEEYPLYRATMTLIDIDPYRDLAELFDTMRQEFLGRRAAA